MLHRFHTKIDTTRWMLGFSISVAGWLEFVGLRVLNPTNLSTMTTYTMAMLALGIGFVLVAWLLKTDKLSPSPIWLSPRLAAPVGLGLGLLAVLTLPVWAGILGLSIASYPVLYEWLRRVTSLHGARRRMFLIAWIGGFAVASALTIAAHWIGTVWAVAVGLGIANLIYLRIPDTIAAKRTITTIKVPKKILALAFELFFCYGIGASSTTLTGFRTSHPVPHPMLTGFLWLTALIAATATMPLLFHKKPRWLVYTGCSILVATLLIHLQESSMVAGPEQMMLLALGGGILCLWWLSIMFDFLRHGAAVLAVGLATVIMAMSGAWVVALLLPHIVQGGSVIASVIMAIVLILPLASTRSTVAGSASKKGGGPAIRVEAFYLEAKLTQQERKIVDLLLSGSNNQDILGQLYISINTLKTHLRNIYRKTDTSNRRELIGVIEQYHAYSSGE